MTRGGGEGRCSRGGKVTKAKRGGIPLQRCSLIIRDGANEAARDGEKLILLYLLGEEVGAHGGERMQEVS